MAASTARAGLTGIGEEAVSAYDRPMAAAGWVCCFCGNEIEEQGVDPCYLTVTTAEEKGQMWACHANCFKQRLATGPFIFDPVHFPTSH